MIKERLGDKAGAATTCNQLAIVAASVGRPLEAEEWYKRAIQLEVQVQAGSISHAKYLNNLAHLLVAEVTAGRALKTRLGEARHYAEQAKLIQEQLGVSTEIWNTFGVLADIANLEERMEGAQGYRRRERESFAAFAGNRYHIDQDFGEFITAIVAAARGDAEARKNVEEELPEYEEDGWHISHVVQRIWAGEQDWSTLVGDMSKDEALLILRVLETLQHPPPETLPSSKKEVLLEDLIASLPTAILQALQQGDGVAAYQAFEGLSEEEQGRVGAILQALQEAQEEHL